MSADAPAGKHGQATGHTIPPSGIMHNLTCECALSVAGIAKRCLESGPRGTSGRSVSHCTAAGISPRLTPTTAPVRAHPLVVGSQLALVLALAQLKALHASHRPLIAVEARRVDVKADDLATRRAEVDDGPVSEPSAR